MPLFKGQGCKSTPGKALDYIMDEKKADIVSSQNLDDSRSYAEQFRDTAKLFDKGGKFDERKYYHFKLSPAQLDRVSPAECQQLAARMAADLFSESECVIVTHADTATIHSHIIVNAVKFTNGSKLHINDKEYAAMKDLANEYGQDMGMSVLDWRSRSAEKVLSAEWHIMLKGGVSWKDELRKVIDEAKIKTDNIIAFEEHLNKYGVTLTRNTEKTIAYLHPERQQAIRGERLGDSYTKGAIEHGFDQQRNRETAQAPAGCYKGLERRTDGSSTDNTDTAIAELTATIEKSKAAIDTDDRTRADRVADEQSSQFEQDRITQRGTFEQHRRRKGGNQTGNQPKRSLPKREHDGMER